MTAEDVQVGKLVPQDPNDQPASVLLDRIKAGSDNRNGDDETVKPRGSCISVHRPANNRRKTYDYRNA